MSSTTQENLLFRITVEQTGSSISEIDQLTKSITGLNTATKGTGGAGTGGFQKILDGINMSAKELNTTLTALNTNFGKLNSGTASAGMSKLSSSTEQASAALQAGTRAAEGFANSTIGAGKGVTTVSDQLGILKNSATTATSATNVLTAGFEKFATAGAMAEKNMFGVANTLSTFGRQADSAAASAQKLGQAETSAASATQRMTQASESANVANQTGLGYDKDRAQQWIQNIRHISGVGLSFMSLYQAMDSVQGIGEMVALQTEKVKEAQDKENQAIAQFGPNSKQAIQAHDAVAKAQRGLAYESREANFAMHNMLFMVGLIGIELTNSLLPILVKAGAAFKALNATTTVAATGAAKVSESILSSIPGFNLFSLGGKKAEKTVVEMAEKMVGSAPKIGYVGEGLKGVSRTASAAAPDIAKIGEEAVNMGAGVLMGAEATTKMSLGQKIMSAASKVGMVALGGLGVSAGTAAIATIAAGAAAAVAAAGLVLYGTNAFGARDAMNAMGVEIGKVNPVFKMVGDIAVSVAGAIGLTGETAEKTRGHLKNVGEDFNTLSTIWNDVVANMQKSNNIIVKDLGNMASLIGTDLKTMAGHFTTQVGASISTWQKLTDAIEKHDYKAAVDIIGQAFSAIPGIIQQIFVDVDKVFTDFMRGQLAFWKNVGMTIASAVQSGLTALATAFKGGLDVLVGIATEVIKRVVTALGLDPVIKNITVGVQTIVKTFNGIVTGIQDMGKAIMDKILGHAKFDQDVQAWLNTNIYTPINQLYTHVTDQAAKIVDGILKSDVGQKVTKWAQDVVAKLMAPFNKIGESIGGGANAIQQGIGGLFGGGKPPVTGNGMPPGLSQQQQLPSQNPQENVPAGPVPTNQIPTGVPSIDRNLLATGGYEPSAYNPFGGQQPGYQLAAQAGTIKSPHIGSKPAGGGPASPTGTSIGDLASVSGAPQITSSADQAAIDKKAAEAAAAQKPSGQQLLKPEMTDVSSISADNKAYQELDDTVKKLQASYKDYDEILHTTEGLHALQAKGVAEQQTAYQGMQAALVSSTAANAEYAKQVQEGGIVNTSYNQGIQDQKKALLDSIVELGHSVGMHKELNDEMKTGVPQMVAFAQGMDEQVGALQQQQLATAKSAGTIAMLETQMKSGEAQAAAYGQGFVEGTLALDQEAVAAEQARGGIDALTAGIQSGQVASVAFAEGVNKQNQVLIDNYKAFYEGKAALAIYEGQLQTGIPQALAFSNALQQQQMASAKLSEETSALAGTMQGMFDDLSNGQTLLEMNAKAFYEGGKAAIDWGTQLATADSNEKGLIQGLQEVANKLGVSTQGFIGNADELKDWIGIMSGAGDAVEKSGRQMYEGGVQMMSKFTDAIAEGGKGAGDELDKIEEKIGIEFPSGIRDALETASTQDIMADNLTSMLEAGQRAVEHADPSAMAEYVDRMKQKGLEGLANLDAGMQQKAGTVIAQLTTLLTHGPENASPEAFNVYATKAKGYLDQLKRAGDPAVQALQPLTNMTFSEQPIEAVQGLIQAMANNQPLTAYQQGLLGIANASVDAQGNTNDLGVTVSNVNGEVLATRDGLTGATTATTGLGTATTGTNTQLQTFLTTMGTMGSVTQQIMANIHQQFTDGFNATFTAINTIATGFFTTFQTTFVTGISTLATPLAQLVQAFEITFTSIIAGTTTFFGTFTSMFPTNFALIAPILQGLVDSFQLTYDTITQQTTIFMQRLVQAVQQGVQQITTAVNTLIGVFNTAFKRAVDDAAGYLKSLVQTNNQSFQQITASVQKIVGVFNDSFKRATGDAMGYIKQLVTTTTQAMATIGQKAQAAAKTIDTITASAKRATEQVKALAREIAALKDRTVTITTRYVTQGSPPAARGMAPTVFMAGGGQQLRYPMQSRSTVYGETFNTKNSRVLVGESGAERVLRTGLKSKNSSVEYVDHMKRITGLGAREPEVLTVVPLEGTNARQFRQKYPQFYAAGTTPAAGVYSAGAYPNPFAAGAAGNPPSPGRQMPSGFSQMLYGRLIKDRHGNITIGGRVVFRAGGPLDVDAYEGRHISHGSHGDPGDSRHFQIFDGSNEDIRHNGIPFSFGSATGFQIQKGMETGIGGTRGQVVGGSGGSGVMTNRMIDEGPPEVPSASMDRMVQSRRVYSDYISERVAAARDRPRTQQQDQVYGNVDNQGNPLMREYNENAYPIGIEPDTPLMHPHTRSNTIKPTRSYEEDYNVFIARLINEITKKVDGRIKINLHSQVDTRIWGKITNEQVLNDMIRS